MGTTHHRSRLVYSLAALVLNISVLAVFSQAIVFAGVKEPVNDRQLIRQAEAIAGMIEDKLLVKSQIPNPHWRKDDCVACHVSDPGEGGSALKAQNDRSCLYCHNAEDHLVTHPVNLEVGKNMLTQMSADFRQRLVKGNKMNCITCHDVLMQCRKRPSAMRLRNSPFMRGGAYNTRTGVCYQCHDKAAYQKLNPHDQVSDGGVLNKDRCLVCHKGIPVQSAGGVVKNVALQSDSNRSEICLNCHRWQPHPGGNMTMFSGGKPPDHLVVPSDRVRSTLLEMTKKNHLDMPLEPGSGKIYCATCHNPHERGVIKKVALAKGADEKNRLRSKRICINCHEK